MMAGKKKDIFKNKWQQAARILTSHVKAKRIKKNSMQMAAQRQTAVGRKRF